MIIETGVGDAGVAGVALWGNINAYYRTLHKNESFFCKK